MDFVTTISLGGNDYEAHYFFTDTNLTEEKTHFVLTQVCVPMPEEAVLSQWIDSFKDMFTNKLYESDLHQYKTPLKVASLLTEQQITLVNQAAVRKYGSGTAGGWPFLFAWFDSSGRMFKFDGSGYAFYLEAQAAT